jgi:ethanolamine ammonia-lyase large subunit
VSGRYGVTLAGRSYAFDDLRTLMARASPRRSGDELAGVAARSQEERVAAQLCLADVELSTFLDDPLIAWEIDDVSRLINEQHRSDAFAPVSSMCVGEFRDWLLSYDTTSNDLAAVAWGLTPEMVAAVSKVMGNQDLVLVASKCSNVTAFRSTIGLPGRLSVRLQPNHPTDDPQGILASVVDGLLLGCGDAVIGINPALDSPQHCRRLLDMLDEVIQRYEIPTQSCVLAHVTTTLRCIEDGAPVDLVFQSIGGTEATNRSFGVTLGLLAEAQEAAVSLQRGTVGSQVMYFETGQGSCLSAGGHHGVDQQTLEARAYAVARQFDPLLVNTVVGFIGPEYLHDGKQVIRAGLEDHFCGKLLGLPMGCDVCYTNHMDADQDDMDVLLTLLGAAGCNFIMGVPGADDVMLGYQSTSFHDANYLRQLLGLRPAPEFEDWLVRMDLVDDRNRLKTTTGAPALLSALDLAAVDAPSNRVL